MEAANDRPRVSVVVPVLNEAGNIGPLVPEIEAALAEWRPFEVVFVDDGSTDGTLADVMAVARGRPWLRALRHRSRCGKSAALRTGIRASRGPVVATLDGDGQNDPAFLPALLAAMETGGAGVGLVAGQRVGRQDTGFKRFQSRIANRIRARALRDGTRDTGCGMKLVRREVFLDLPFFDGLHRFLPALVAREGYEVRHVDVIDRPRRYGTSAYGIWDRLWVGILDLFGVWWLIRRSKKRPQILEAEADAR